MFQKLAGEPRITVGKHRVEALADGVFAIVLTLLVLELRLPDLPRHVPQAELFHALGELRPVGQAPLAFLLAGLFWYQHHIAMHYVQQSDRGFVWLNLLFLCFVALLPFTCGLFGRFLRVQGVASIYYLNEAVIGFALLAGWQYARRRQLVGEIDPAINHRLSSRFVMLPCALTGAAVISYWYPNWAMIPFLLGALYIRLSNRRFASTHAA